MPRSATQAATAAPEADQTQLRECYQACIARRVARGELSVRTRRGYHRLCSRYAPRLQFVPSSQTSKEPGGTVNEILSLETTGHSEGIGSESDSANLREVVGVFFDPKVLQLVADVCWPLVHFGGNVTADQSVPDWLELEEAKYSTFMLHILEWLFSGLPGVEAQDQAQRDWQHDREFDAFGNAGLSLEGFTVSLLDLAVACTDGSAEKSIEFLQQMAAQLRRTLPAFRTPVLFDSVEDDTQEDLDVMTHAKPAPDGILWQLIPLSLLTPCELRPQAQYFELKMKVSTSPMVIMILLGDEAPVELQLSTSAKLLVRERDSRTSIRRKTIALKAHFIELEHQSLWTFRDLNSAQPSLLLVPNGSISRRTKSLYACLRLLDSHERELHGAVGRTRRQSKPALASMSEASASRGTQENAWRSSSPLLTLFTSVPELCPLPFGPGNGLCLRIDRMTSRLFTIDHHERMEEPFEITLTTSLLQSTSSAGGAGAAATVSSSFEAQSFFTVGDTSRQHSSRSAEEPTSAHTFVFVVKDQQKLSIPELSTVVVGRETVLPRQWFTSMSAANETKTIVIEPSTGVAQSDQSSDHSSSDDEEEDEDYEYDTGAAQLVTGSGIYYLHVFTLHGIYLEAVYSTSAFTEKTPAKEANPTEGHKAQTVQPLAAVLDVSDRSVQPPNPAAATISSTSKPHQAQVPVSAQVPSIEPVTPNLKSDDGKECVALIKTDASLTTTADLLRELLLLRKKRQLEATANPPDFLTGTKVCTSKTITTASALRSKVLRARQLERRARLEELEELFRDKLMQKYLRVRAPRRQGSTSVGIRNVRRGGNTEFENASEIPELEARVNLLTTFFHEMAVHQPTLEELSGGTALGVAEKIELQAEERLLKHFGDLFEGDVTLHNVLDEEKWSTEVGKAERRRVSLATNLPKGSPGSATDQLLAVQSGGDNTPLSFEDYENTARYIEQLMKDAANDNREQLHERETADLEREQEAMARLVSSWGYGQHRSVARQMTVQQLGQVEQRRRAEWMQSHYVKASGDAALARRRDVPERPTLVPPKQRFLVQEQSLPWNPIWEVPSSWDGELSTVATNPEECVALPPPTLDHRVSERPQPPAQRAATALQMSPNTPKRSIRSAASRSASLARSHVHRIRSAPNYGDVDVRRSRQSPRYPSAFMRRPTGTDQEPEGSSQRKPVISYVPEVFLSLAASSIGPDPSDHDDEASPRSDKQQWSGNSGSSGANADAAVLDIEVNCPVRFPTQKNRSVLETPRAEEKRDPLVCKAAAKSPKRRKQTVTKKRFGYAAEAARFRRSVRELMSLPLKLERAAAEEREISEAIEELASVHFTLPTRPGKKKTAS